LKSSTWCEQKTSEAGWNRYRKPPQHVSLKSRIRAIPKEPIAKRITR
jgi:hypothetical protein